MNYEDLIEDHLDELLNPLLKDILKRKAAEFHFDYEEDDQWSSISMHNNDDDAEISLRLHEGNRYELYVGYYDADDEFLELTRQLTTEETKMIPAGIQKVMAKVLADEEGMRVPGKLLSK